MISYHSEQTTLPGPKSVKLTTDWINEIIAETDKTLVQLSYVFCSDNYLLDINKKHLNHDTFTDIITFDNSDETAQIEADVFISLERIKENAITHGTDYQNELHRVMVHGLLHLLGHNDKTAEEKVKMTQMEDAALSQTKCFT